MCFSAEVSFTASAALSACAVGCLAKVKYHKNPDFFLLALMPLIFAVQQLLEGLVWLNLGNHPHVIYFAIGYLFFAFFFWPPYYTLALRKVEKDPTVRLWQKWIFVLAVLFGLAIYIPTILPNALHVSRKLQSIFYYASWLANNETMQVIAVVAYLGPLLAAGFLSTLRSARFFTIALLISIIISQIFYHYALTSVWCFMGAWLSVTIFFIIQREPKRVKSLLAY